jgi:hypothetical protein
MNATMKTSYKLSAEQFAQHQVRAVTTVLNPTNGDGYIDDNPDNLQTEGMLLRLRSSDVPSRSSHHYEMISLDSALVQIGLVGENIHTEAERISGDVSGLQAPVAGELPELEVQRRRILGWIGLTTSQQTEATDYFRRVATVRTLATSRSNGAIWTVATDSQTLSMGNVDDSEIDKMDRNSFELRELLTNRYDTLLKNRYRNELLDLHQLAMVRDENNRLATANEQLDTLIQNPHHPITADLAQTARRVLFRVQPFNQLALALKIQRQSGDRDDPTPYQTAQQGLFMKRFTNHILAPIRPLTDVSKVGLRELDAEQTVFNVNERLALFAELELSWPYDYLRDRILAAGEKLAVHTQGRKITALHRTAKQIQYLMEHHCLPNEPVLIDTWYGHRLLAQLK